MLTKDDVFVGKKIIVVEACLCYKFMKLLIMVGSCKLWHDRQGYVNHSSIKKMLNI